MPTITFPEELKNILEDPEKPGYMQMFFIEGLKSTFQSEDGFELANVAKVKDRSKYYITKGRISEDEKIIINLSDRTISAKYLPSVSYVYDSLIENANRKGAGLDKVKLLEAARDEIVNKQRPAITDGALQGGRKKRKTRKGKKRTRKMSRRRR